MERDAEADAARPRGGWVVTRLAHRVGLFVLAALAGMVGYVMFALILESLK